MKEIERVLTPIRETTTWKVQWADEDNKIYTREISEAETAAGFMRDMARAGIRCSLLVNREVRYIFKDVEASVTDEASKDTNPTPTAPHNKNQAVK